MAKFDGKKLVSALEYDFTSIPKSGSNGKTIYCKGKGFIPEPTDEAIDTYRKAYMRMQAEAQGFRDEVLRRIQEAESEEDIQAAMREMEGAFEQLPAVKDVREKLTPAMVAMTDGSPSEEQLQALPSRALRVFAQWLFDEVNDPNASSVATRN